MMNQEIKKKWVEALRSGKYKQTRKVLKSPDNKYCCLGVLCAIVRPNEDYKDWRRLGYGQTPEEVPNNSILNECQLPYTQLNHLVAMNDSDGCDFQSIADYVQRNL